MDYGIVLTIFLRTMRVMIFLIKLISLLPTTILLSASGFVAFVLRVIFGYRKEVIEKNLERSFPEKSQAEIARLASEYYSHLSNQFLETIRLWSMPKKELLQRVTFKNPELLEAYESNGRSVIIMMGHSGNWEWAGLACAARFKFQMTPVYRKIKNRPFNEFYKALRSRFGATPLLDKESSKSLAKYDGSCAVAMLADQTAGAKKGWWLTFLNQPTPIYRGSEILAKRLPNFDVLFAHVHRNGKGRYSIDLAKPTERWRNEQYLLTISFAKFLESEIKKDPANWLWSHKRWKHALTTECTVIDAK